MIDDQRHAVEQLRERPVRHRTKTADRTAEIYLLNCSCQPQLMCPRTVSTIAITGRRSDRDLPEPIPVVLSCVTMTPNTAVSCSLYRTWLWYPR